MLSTDLRHMLRQMRRNPFFALVTIAVVALGIGATAAVFGLVSGVVFRPLPYTNPDRLAVVWEDLVKEENHTYSVTPATYFDIKKNTKSFDAVAAQQTGGGFTLRDDKSAQVIRAGMVTGDFFATVGASAAMGRTLTPSDETEHVVVLSDALWHSRFGGDQGIVGKSILLDDVTYTVVGVMPAAFDSPWVFKASHIPAALWVPLTGLAPTDRKSATLQVIVRRRSGVSMEAAQAELAALANSLESSHPETNKDVGLNMVDMREQIVGRVRTPLLLLLGSIMFLLLIACANLASLLLQRALGRSHELAIRVAIGASRRRIITQLITENVFLAMIGGAAGALAGVYGLRALVALAPADTPRLPGVRPDAAIFSFAALATIVVAMLLALPPAVRATRDISGVLRSGRMRSHEWTRSALAFVQVTLAVVLLSGGTLLVRSFERLSAVNPGFDAKNVLTLRVALPPLKYADAVTQANAMAAVVDAATRVPGVERAAITSRPPLDPPYGYAKVFVQGATVPADDQALAGYRAVSPAYLRTLRVPVLQGRDLAVSDKADGPAVMVVNRAFARKYLGDRQPLGAHIAFGDVTTGWVEIVGVSGDMNNGSLEAEAIPEAFIPLDQSPIGGGTLVARTTTDPRALARAVQDAIAGVDPTIATQEPMAMQDIASASIALPRFSAFLVSTFASLALLLSVIGIYAIFAQAVTSQERELGIRAALGAPARMLLMPVLRQGLLIATAGIACGLAGAVVATRLLQSQLFGVSAGDASTYVVVAILMFAVTLAGCMMPGHRILQTDPATALRSD